MSGIGFNLRIALDSSEYTTGLREAQAATTSTLSAIVAEASRTGQALGGMTQSVRGTGGAVRREATEAGQSLQQIGQDARQSSGIVAQESARLANALRQVTQTAAAQQQFLQGLRDQAAAVGKSESELLSYRAAQLGVGSEARVLITQLQQARAAVEAKAKADASAAKTAADEARATQQQADAQRHFLETLREQAATSGMNPEQLLRYRAAQLGVGQQAETLIQQLHRQGQAGQVSAAQTAAAMRMVPAQMTDIVTQLQGGASPLTVLIQQGGQLRDSFGGIGPMFRALAGMITPVGAAIAAVAAAVSLVGFAAVAGARESSELRHSIALTGGAAGVTVGQINAMGASLVDAKGVTIGTAREITAALVESGRFSGAALDSTAAAAASLSRISGQSADEIIKDFSQISDGVTAWAIKANRSYSFLSAAQVAQIRELESQGRISEAVRLTMDALSGTMDQRLGPALGSLERGWHSVKSAISSAWDSLKGIGRDQTVADQLDSITAKLAKLDERQSASGQMGGILGRQAQERIAAERADLLRQQAALQQRTDAEKAAATQQAADAAAEQKKIEEGSKAHVDAVLAVERAGDAQRLAAAQAGIEQRLQSAAAGYQRGQTDAQQYGQQLLALEKQRGALQIQQIEQQIAAEKRRVVETPRDRLAQQAAIGQLEAQLLQQRTQQQTQQRELARSIAASQDALDLARQQAHSDAAARLLDDAQARLEARQRAGLATAEQVADAKLDIERARLAQQLQMIDAQITAEQRRQQSGTGAIDAQAKIEGLQSQRASLQQRIDLTVVTGGAQQAERELAQSRTDAQAWAQAWQQADQQVRSLAQQNAQARAALITDPVERAKTETALQIAEIERAAKDQARDLQIRLDLTTDPAQQAALKERIQTLAAETTDSIALANAGLADRLKPGWRTMLEGWQDTQRLMRESSDETMQKLVSGGEDAFAEFVKTGKLTISSLVDDMLGQLARVGYRQAIGSLSDALSKGGGASGLSSLLSLAAPQTVKGYSGSEGNANFMGPPAALAAGADTGAADGLAATDKAATQATGALSAMAAVAGQNTEAGQALTVVQMGLQAAQSLGMVTQQVASSAEATALGELTIAAMLAASGLEQVAASAMMSGGGGMMGLAATGAVVPFARGGQFTNSIVASPTLFVFARGSKLGLMGEAGPEAIMPLSRRAGGHAVDAVDGGGRLVGALQIMRGRGGRMSVVLDEPAAGADQARATPAAVARFALGGLFSPSTGGNRAGAAAALADSMPAAPASSSPAAGGSTVTINQTITIAAGVSANDVSMAMARAKAEAVAAVADQMRRGNRSFSA